MAFDGDRDEFIQVIVVLRAFVMIRMLDARYAVVYIIHCTVNI